MNIDLIELELFQIGNFSHCMYLGYEMIIATNTPDPQQLELICAEEYSAKNALAPLGITARSISPPITSIRKERFKIQRIAAELLAKKAKLKFPDKYAGDTYRVCDCNWASFGSVSVHKSVEHGTAHLKNVVTCGSIWTCAVCAARISERRRIEISEAMNKQYEREGKKCVMVTFTAPHGFSDNLDDLFDKQAKALNLLRNGKAWQKQKQKMGFDGLIRSLEITVSRKNGWHPHTHELWFIDSSYNSKELKKIVLKRWERACEMVGLLNPFKPAQINAFKKYSVDIKDNARCSDYLAKMDDKNHWGADREIAKAASKSAKTKGFHPFALLSEIDKNNENSDWAMAKFSEYADASKGKRAIVWSRGLKALFEIGEKTDEEISAEITDKTLTLIGFISKDQWLIIRKMKVRFLIYELAEVSKSALDLWLVANTGKGLTQNSLNSE